MIEGQAESTMVHEEDWVIAGTEAFLHVATDEVMDVVVRIFQETIIHLVVKATLQEVSH